jgi:hypothetical protein
MCDATGIDAEIKALAARRAAMRPGHPVIPPVDPTMVHEADNMLWHVRPAVGVSAIELAMFHPGLGWTSMKMSRAQVEDLQDAIALALRDMPLITNNAAPGQPGAYHGSRP